MKTISLCMIVKNEEEHLGRCLDSCSCEEIFDEIVIVDTGSTDRTKEIARKYTSKVFDFQWVEDFAKARNFAFSKGTSDYLMWLDADDIIPEKSRVALIELKKRLTDEDVVKMPYAVGFDSEDKPTYVFERERILRNCPQAKWAGFIHECIASFGKIVTEEILIEHRKIHAGDSDRNLRIYEKHIADGAKLNPRDMFYFARELYYHNRNQEAIDVFTAFLDSRKGWIENNIEACKLRAKCFNNLKDRKNALKSLFESFLFDNPRAEICCDIGLNFFEEKEYKQAIFWYETALKQEPNAFSGGFVLPECYGYIPALQLCVCYSRLGENKKAFEYNEIGAKYKVTPAITFNRKYFESTGLIMSNV